MGPRSPTAQLSREAAISEKEEEVIYSGSYHHVVWGVERLTKAGTEPREGKGRLHPTPTLGRLRVQAFKGRSFLSRG